MYKEYRDTTLNGAVEQVRSIVWNWGLGEHSMAMARCNWLRWPERFRRSFCSLTSLMSNNFCGLSAQSQDPASYATWLKIISADVFPSRFTDVPRDGVAAPRARKQHQHHQDRHRAGGALQARQREAVPRLQDLLPHHPQACAVRLPDGSANGHDLLDHHSCCVSAAADACTGLHLCARCLHMIAAATSLSLHKMATLVLRWPAGHPTASSSRCSRRCAPTWPCTECAPMVALVWVWWRPGGCEPSWRSGSQSGHLSVPRCSGSASAMARGGLVVSRGAASAAAPCSGRMLCGVCAALWALLQIGQNMLFQTASCNHRSKQNWHQLPSCDTLRFQHQYTMPLPRQFRHLLFVVPLHVGHMHGRGTSGFSLNGDHSTTLSPALANTNS